VGSTTDPPQLSWFLRWTPYALGHLRNPLLSDRLDVPTGVNLMWNTLMPLPGVLLWPITVTFGPLFSLTLLATLAPALSAFSAYVALRRLVGSPPASVAGGLLYGFSPYVMAESHGHANAALAVIPPLMVIVLDEVLVRQRGSVWRCGALLGALAAAQLLMSEEMLASEVLIAAIAVAVLAVQHRDRVRGHTPYGLQALGVASLVFLPVAAGPLVVQFATSPHFSGTVAPSGRYVSDLLNIVLPTGTQALAPQWSLDVSARYSGNAAEWAGYLGIPLLVALAWTATSQWRNPTVRFWTWLGVAAVVLSLGPSLHVAGHDTGVPLPWRAADGVPLVNDILPSRLMLYADLAAAVLLAMFVRALPAFGARRALLMALLTLSALSLAPASLDVTHANTPEFFTSRAVETVREDSVALVAPIPSAFDSDAMLWQAEAGMRFRMLGGYFVGADPLGRDGSALLDAVTAIETGGPAPPLDATSRQRMLTELQSRGVATVIVGPMPRHDAEIAFLTALLGSPPTSTGGVELWQVVT
jgi:hypothetical protein